MHIPATTSWAPDETSLYLLDESTSIIPDCEPLQQEKIDIVKDIIHKELESPHPTKETTEEVSFTELISEMPTYSSDLSKELDADGSTKGTFDPTIKSSEELLKCLSSIELSSDPEREFELYLNAINTHTDRDIPALSRALKDLLIRLSTKEAIEAACAIFTKCSEHISNASLWELLIEVVKMRVDTSSFCDLINSTISKRKATHKLGGGYFYLFLKHNCTLSCMNFYQLSEQSSVLAHEIQREFIAQNLNNYYKIDLNIWKVLLGSSCGSQIIAPYLLTCLQTAPWLLSLRDEEGKTIFQINREASFNIKGLIENTKDL